MRKNRITQLAAEGRPILNAWAGGPSAYSAELLRHQGFDSVTVDLQHGMIGFDAAVAMLQVISATPAVPLARVAQNDSALVMQLLDAGAYGIICPMISSGREAQDFVSYCRYRPQGQRSYGPARGLLFGGPDYFAHAHEEILAFAIIETREAVADLDAILATDGLSGIYIGPNDQSLAYGAPPQSEPTDPDVAETILDISQRCRSRGRIPGIFCSSGEAAAHRLSEGFQMVTPGNDAGLLTRAAREAVAACRP